MVENLRESNTIIVIKELRECNATAMIKHIECNAIIMIKELRECNATEMIKGPG